MRRALIGLVLALGAATAAQASDFIVVNSTDPALHKGQAFDAGAAIPVGAGKTVTLMRASGEVMVLKGSAAGARAPNMQVAAADSARFEAMRALVGPPPEGRTFGARRGGALCQPADTLLTLDAIVDAANAGCKPQAREAMDAYVAKAQASAPTN